jgi:hypothetical protein
MVVDLEAGVMRVPAPLEKRQAVRTLISKGLSQRRRFHVRDLARFKGKLVAMQWEFGHVAFLYTKAMDRAIAAQSSWNVHVKLFQDTVDELHFW